MIAYFLLMGLKIAKNDTLRNKNLQHTDNSLRNLIYG